MPRLSIHHARPILGCLVALVMALTTVVPGPATAQQTSAADRQLGQILGALLIAGGVAKVLDDRKDRKKARRAEEAQRAEEARREAERRAAAAARRNVHRDFDPIVEPGHRRGDHARAVLPSPRAVLPSRCLRDVTGGPRVKRVVGQNCLQRNGVRAALPVNCATLVEVGGRFRTAYTASCLSDAGFQFR